MNRLAATALAVCFGVSACKGSTPEDPTKKPAPGVASAVAAAPVTVDGSSTVALITEAVAEEFQKANPGKKVTMGVSGTGGGFKKFCGGELSVSGASRPIKPAEVELCGKNGIEYVELPVAYDGLTIVVHAENDWATSITVAELKKMWAPEAQGTVKKWSDVRPGWPDQEIHLFGAGVDSGTYDYFTAAVVGKEHSSRGDYTSSEDDNVLVKGVSTDKLALGFFGYAYYIENKGKLKLVPVDDEKAENGAGPIAPSLETVANGTYQPLSRPIFIYAGKKQLERPEVSAFVNFYLANAPTLSAEVGYIPLTPAGYALATERFTKRTYGSVFGEQGSSVGVSVELLLGAPPAAPASEAMAPSGPPASAP